MTIKRTINDSAVTLALEGRLDITSSPELEALLSEILPTTTALVFDLTDLSYISSSGLRVLLKAQKVISKQGTMVVTGVNEIVMEVFEVTGFSSILTIE